MLIEVSNTLTVENPTPEMVLWCKRNLTIPNPEYAKKSRMNLWLGNTPKVLSLYETRGTTLVLPFGTLRLLPKDISDKALFLSEFAAPVEVNYNADVPLYDYQEIAVQAMVAAKYGILQSAAGSGKTQMGIALAARLGRRTLWLCHTLDLIKQSKERAKLYMSEDLMGTITEGKVNLGEGITFATIQTMCKLDLAQYRDYWDCIITDEVHRVSGSPTAVTQYQKVLNSLSARHKYGLSATVHRSDGMIKAKGSYLVKGIAPAGAFNINNSCVIVATALKEFFVNGTPVEDTINSCDDIFQFQIIAKAGAKYREAYHVVDGEKQSVQKVNRVYATADERYGKIFKVKAEDDSEAKIDSLPEHCIIDNDNELSIDEVDRSFYIAMAKKRVDDFKGIKPEKTKKPRRTKKMATTTKTTNVYQKLLTARAKFLEANVEKTGKNMHLSFKYFELEDIVPTAIRIFNEVGLIPVVNFTADVATMNIINTDNPEESVPFVAPFNQIAPIVSNAGKQATNEMQALGSSITYMRRYLYMIALDICESDSIDANLGNGETASAPAAEKKAPATPEQRQEVKENLTAPADNASALQIKGLKAVLKKLKDADPSKEELIANIAVQTKGFTEISKSDCETLIQKITAMLEGGAK